MRQPDGGTEQIDDAGKATEGRGLGRRTGEHLPARQGRLGLGSGDTNAEPAEAVDNQCVDRHGAVIIATCNVSIGPCFNLFTVEALLY